MRVIGTLDAAVTVTMNTYYQIFYASTHQSSR